MGVVSYTYKLCMYVSNTGDHSEGKPRQCEERVLLQTQNWKRVGANNEDRLRAAPLDRLDGWANGPDLPERQDGCVPRLPAQRAHGKKRIRKMIR